MKDMKLRPLEVAEAVVAALMALLVMTLFRACAKTEEGMYMNCHNAQMIVFCIALIITMMAVAKMVINKDAIRPAMTCISIALSLVAVITPGILVKLCMMNNMRCHMVMRPFSVVLGLISAVIAVIDFIGLRRNK